MKNQWDEFDCTLATSLSELPPPEEAIHDVTPFRDAVFYIVLGLCLTCFTLNLWYLQYLLPAVGSLLIYLGFRSLRGNNLWFRLSWYISICKVILLYGSYILAATPFAQASSIVWAVLTVCMTLALFLSFHFGLNQAAREIGLTLQRHPALWAALWYGILVLLALISPDIGWLGFIIMFIAFVCIVRSMLRVSAELEGWGYSVRAAPVRCGTGFLSVLYFGSLVILILLCAAYFNHPSIDSEDTEPVSEASSTETILIQTQLTELGFPEELLTRLPAEEVEKLSTAIRCEAVLAQTAAGSEKGLDAFRFDTVYVQTAPRTFRVYEFFTLQRNTLRSNWRVLIQLETSPLAASVSDISCGIVWTKDGASYRGCPKISGQAHEDFFFGPSTLPSAVFSYPFFSQNRGGYMAYNIVLEDDWIYFGSVLRAYLSTYRNFYPYIDLLTDTLQTDWYAQSYSICEIEPD